VALEPSIFEDHLSFRTEPHPETSSAKADSVHFAWWLVPVSLGVFFKFFLCL